MRKLRSLFQQLKQEESGQAIIIVAAALIVLIGFTGLAIDLGFVWMRQAQLKSTVDSAALAGVTELKPTSADGGLGNADAQAIQYLATNQILDTNGVVPLDELETFESANGLSALGAREYTITVTWDIPLFFMPVFGFDNWEMTESSTAAYFPLVDLYSGRRVALNGVTTSTQAVFGPDQGTSFGDAFSNPSSPFIDARGVRNVDGDFSYVYRIEVPESYQGNVIDNSNTLTSTNILRVELLDPDSVNNLVPLVETLYHSEKFIRELQNAGIPADQFNQPVDENDCYQEANNLHQPCAILTCEWSSHEGTDRCASAPYSTYYGGDPDTNPYEVDQINPFWFYRLDELRQPGGNSTSAQHETVTLYTLYYFQREADGSIVKQFLSSYAGQSRDAANLTRYEVPPIGQYHTPTDLSWVSPGAWNEIGNVPTRCNTQTWARNNGGFKVAGDTSCTVTNPGEEDALPSLDGSQDSATMGRGFEIDLTEDVPGILIDQVSGAKYIYLDIKTVEGASENGFEVWAGPPHARYGGFHSNVNKRNLVLNGSNAPLYGPDGVNVYSVGILPLNSIADNRVEFPLVYVSPQYAGRDIELTTFDADSGTQLPVCFYFDTIPNPDCETGFDDTIDGYLKYYGNLPGGGNNLAGRCFPSCQNRFVEPPFVVTVPDFTVDCDPDGPFEERMEKCNAFLGGRLMVSYHGGRADTYQWLVNFPSVPYIKN